MNSQVIEILSSEAYKPTDDQRNILAQLPGVEFDDDGTPVVILEIGVGISQIDRHALRTQKEVEQFIAENRHKIKTVAPEPAPIPGAPPLAKATADHAAALAECSRCHGAAGELLNRANARRGDIAGAKNESARGLADALLAGSPGKDDAKVEKKIVDATAALDRERAASKIISEQWAGAASSESKARQDMTGAKHNEAANARKKAMEKADELRRQAAEQDRLAANANAEIERMELAREHLGLELKRRVRVQLAFVGDGDQFFPGLQDVMDDPTFPGDRAAIVEIADAWRDGLHPEKDRSKIFWPDFIAIIYDAKTGKVFSIEILSTMDAARVNRSGECCTLGDSSRGLTTLIAEHEKALGFTGGAIAVYLESINHPDHRVRH
jgi:hypothetical protein